jgi:TRAP-type C4-dicarboxylate transport system permease small subunit
MLIAPLRWIAAVNTAFLKVGRWIGVVAIAFMVVAILIQVVFRYVLNHALPWPDEAARFCMLWMTGLMAPTAYRRGGFVAIDMLALALPRIAGQLLTLFLLLMSLLVLIFAVKIGWSEVTGFGGRFTTASLYLPTSLTFDSYFRIPRSWMMLSLLVGVVLLAIVNIELILRSIITMLGGEEDLPPIEFVRLGGTD